MIISKYEGFEINGNIQHNKSQQCQEGCWQQTVDRHSVLVLCSISLVLFVVELELEVQLGQTQILSSVISQLHHQHKIFF